MPKLTPYEACEILNACNVPVPAIFHELPSKTIHNLLMFAYHYKYRQTKNANGSRARSYHDYLQRVAARKSS